ncbi:MAG: hypothetical protein O3A92_01105 [Verrucomicrobia bacterium]|nr:hypothetical protein [Verrucomicrobiota bacterium]
MSAPKVQEQPIQTTDSLSLRFSCRYCRMELAAPLSVAGVVAPCPGCGREIQAPSAPPPPSGEAVAERPPTAPLREKQGMVRVERRVRKRRKASSAKGGTKLSLDVSEREEEKRQVRALIRFALAIFATVAIVLAVYWVVQGGNAIEPVPDAFPAFPTR